VSVEIPAARAEEARARMIELFPGGFEEIDRPDGVELVAYTDAGGEEQMWQAFGRADATADIGDGWETRWRDFHRPVRVGDLWIGPPWQEPPHDAIPVVIDPGRAFGTGAHPTTRLVLELLAAVERGSVLDVGCGSGVLSIAAVKLGFAPVTAIDVEAEAVAATRRNAQANGVSVSARRADALTDSLPDADVTVANVTREVVEQLAPHVRSPHLIASGYLVSEPPALPAFRHVSRASADGWAADLFERSAS
jgi:ribosomal protein L11 methyltransferase